MSIAIGVNARGGPDVIFSPAATDTLSRGGLPMPRPAAFGSLTASATIAALHETPYKESS